MSSYQCTDGLVSHNACATGSTGNIKRTTGKLHERLWPNIKLQKWGKNRRIQSVHSEEPTCSLQKCYSADDNMLGTHMSLSNSVDEEIIYEDHCIVPNIHIRAATIDKLVEELLIHIEQSCESLDDISDDNLVFPKIFFLVHNWFSTSESIGRKLYNNADIKHKSDSSFEDDRILRSNRKFKIGGVTLAFCLWIEFYPNDFMGSESCMPILTKFIESLQEMGREDLITTLEKSLNSSYDRSRGLSLRMSVRQPVSNSLKLASSNSETCSLVFNQIHPLKLAEQLTVIEFKAFRRITIQDLKLYSLTATVRNIPTLERSVYIFNGLSQWVQCMILNKTAPSERAKVVEKFLLIAENLLVLQNFNSFYAVIGGITHSAISRMNATMMSLSISAQKMLEEYTKIISSSNNYSNYRQLQKEAKGFHIPVVAVHLKDLIFYHTALPDHLYNRNLINFRKFAQSAATLQSILDQQLTQMCIEQNIDLCNTLRLSLDLQYTEEDIYELSLAREPKSSIDSPVANKSILFGDFVSGVKPPTVDVLKQHVNGMVEAVFKVYDNDKDGLISSEEFELVAENFPFIDSFAVLDADKDGVISKYEMKMYFLKANHNALKNSFKHEFYENTYFKPTFCTHCTGLLWGLIKQGWRCRDCGINAHKHCKEQVVMECRSRGHLYQHNRSSSQSTETNVSFQSLGSPPCSSRQITIDRKRKMSQQRKKRTIVNVETQTSGILSESDMSTLESTSSFEKESNHVYIYSEDDPFDDCDKSHLIETLLRYQKEKNELEIEIKMMQEKFKIQANNIEILQDTVTQLRQKIVKFVLDIMDIFNNH